MRQTLIALLLFLSACARPVAPTGGAKDTEPPKLIAESSTPNFLTNFSRDRIELVFDEWVVLQNAAQQVVVSPALPGSKNLPDISLKGKTVTIRFEKDQALRPNTTYTINLGSAVRDLHEGNPVADLRVVFSTGDFIDSLAVSGFAVDAFNGGPLENATAMLYENTADSAVLTEKPFYFARTDKSGRFSLQNLKAGTYRFVVIEDLSSNLRWEAGNERIGFADSLLTLGDTSKPILRVRLFQQEPPFRVLQCDTSTYGRAYLKFTAPPGELTVKTDNPDAKIYPEWTGDSLTVWFEPPQTAAWNLFVGKDTIRIPVRQKQPFAENHRLQWHDASTARPAGGKKFNVQAQQTPATRSVAQNPLKKGELVFNAPVAAWDTSLWALVLDSLPLNEYAVFPDSQNPRKLLFDPGWRPEGKYKLTFLPGAVTDIWAIPNADTLSISFQILPEKSLSTLNLTLTALTPGDAYVFELIDGKTIVDLQTFTASDSTRNLLFRGLESKAYTLRVVDDRNRNGRWDPGNYLQRLQPETLRTKTLPPLRANWEVEERF